MNAAHGNLMAQQINTSMAVTQGPVMSETVAQHDALMALDRLIAELEGMISPILSPESVENGTGEPSAPSACELHARLRGSTEFIDAMKARIATIIGRVRL